MSLLEKYKENKRYREKYNTEHIERLTLQAENDRKDIIIEELQEVVASVRKIWIDANNEKELKIVELTEQINELKRGNKRVSKSTNASSKLSRTKQDNNK